MLPFQGAPLPGTQAGVAQVFVTPAPTMAPGCPWDCLIDETVPTMGRSNEDDALYEIFYTNPLNCCGTIVEIGAEDGVRDSASYFFEKGMNWTTIIIEADPILHAQMADQRTSRKTRAVNGAFCENGPYLYFDEGTHLFQSPADEDFASELMGEFEVGSATTRVNCINLEHILAGIDHINVMIVRVKGDPWAAVKTFDWEAVMVDIWVILAEARTGLSHNSTRDALKLHGYVPAAWDIKLWCDIPETCSPNEVWLRKGFNPVHKNLLGHRGLRGSNEHHLV